MPSIPNSRSSTAARAALAVLAALFALALLPAAASASKSQSTIFDATSALVFTPERLSGAERKARLDELKGLGTDTLRLLIPWRYVTPAVDSGRKPGGFDAADPGDYPAGAFASLDAAVRGATARGMRILLEPAGPIPDWGSASGRSDVAKPKPKQFGLFVRALGKRYGGGFRAGGARLPRVRIWSIYNEPNQSIFLRPQFKNGKPYSPVLYRRLFLAGRKALATTGHRRDRILIGETAPSGGRGGIDPIPFMRGVLCLDKRFKRGRGCPRIKAAGWSHHPYSLDVPPFRRSRNPGLINMATIGRLAAALGKAARAGATTRRLPLYLTEFGVQSVPDRQFGVSLYKQAVYLAVSEFLAWRNPRIRSYGQYLLRDDPVSFEFGFTTGLRMNNGRAKPSHRSFPMTLLARRAGNGKVILWGHVRPGHGRRKVTIRFRKGGRRARVLKRVRTGRRGYFRIKTRAWRNRRYRAEARVGHRRLTGMYIAARSI